MTDHRWHRAVASGLVALSLGFATGGIAGRPPAAVVWTDAAPTTLHPLYAWTPADRRVQALLYESLFEPDGQGGWRSDLIESVTTDGAEARLVLESEPRWSDGVRVSGSDVCATVTRLLDTTRASPLTAAARARLDGCTPDPLDPRKVVVTLRSPSVDARTALAVPLLPAHHEPALSATHRTTLDEVVGTGPFAVASTRTGLTLQARAPGLAVRSLEWRVAERPEINTRAFLAGEGDGVLDVPPAMLDACRAGDAVVHVDPQHVVWSLALNTHLAPLDDPRVREALDLLIDRTRLRDRWVGSVPAGATHPWTPTSGPFPPSWDASNSAISQVLRDESQARALLEAAGLERREDGRWLHAGAPWTLQLVVPEGQGIDASSAVTAIEDQLPGIALDVAVVGGSQWWFSVLAGGHIASTHLALVPRHLAIDPDPGAWFHTRTATGGWHNVFDWSSAEADRLVAEWRSGDPVGGGRRLHALLADERPHLFLLAVEGRTAWRPTWQPVLASPGDLFGRFSEWGLREWGLR